MSAGSFKFVKAGSAGFWLVALLFVLELACASGKCSAKNCNCKQVAVANNAIIVLKAYYNGNYRKEDQAEVSRQMAYLADHKQNLANYPGTSQCVVDLARCMKLRTADLAYCLREPFKASFPEWAFESLAGWSHQPANCVDSKNWPKLNPRGCD